MRNLFPVCWTDIRAGSSSSEFTAQNEVARSVVRATALLFEFPAAATSLSRSPPKWLRISSLSFLLNSLPPLWQSISTAFVLFVYNSMNLVTRQMECLNRKCDEPKEPEYQPLEKHKQIDLKPHGMPNV